MSSSPQRRVAHDVVLFRQGVENLISHSFATFPSPYSPGAGQGTSLEHDPSGALTGMLNTNVFENMRDPVLHGAVIQMRLHVAADKDEDAADASAPHSVVPFLRACLRVPTVVSFCEFRQRLNAHVQGCEIRQRLCAMFKCARPHGTKAASSV